MKAIILARVSTTEQEDGHSLDAQINRLKDYCQRKGLIIDKEFVIVESSTRGERPEFNKMITYIKSQKEKIALVCDKVDRLQRSFKEVPILEELRRSGKLVLHFNVENQILDENASSSQIMAYQMFVMMAENYTNCISDNVRRSIEKKLNEGSICGKAPVGYINTLDKNGNKTVIIDPMRGHIIKKLFEEYATGLVSYKELADMAFNWGLRGNTSKPKPLVKNQISSILQNPFYYGYMKVKDNLYAHIYEPLITRELFRKCELYSLHFKIGRYCKQLNFSIPLLTY